MNIKYRLAVLFVMTAGFFWSGMGTSIRFIDEASTWQILFYRSIFFLCVLIAFILLTYRKKTFKAVNYGPKPVDFYHSPQVGK